jgi:hypothetical protein
LVDGMTAFIFCLALLMSLFYNWRSWQKNKKPVSHQ